MKTGGNNNLLELSSNDVLSLFGKKARSTLTDWRKMGAGEFSLKKNRWDATGLLSWWAETVYLPKNNQELTDSRERWEKARAEKIEIEVERMRGDLLPRDEMIAALTELITIAKKGFMILPKSAPALLYGQTETEMMATLEKMVLQFLTDMERGADIEEVEANLKA